MRTRLTRIGAGLAVPVLAAGLLALTPSAADAATVATDNLQAAAAGWLTTQFAGSNHEPAPGGNHTESYYGGSYYPNYGENADIAFGLAAAHVGLPVIRKAVGYLGSNVNAYADISGKQGGPYDGAVAKTAVAAEVAGASPRKFGGYNLLDVLSRDECAAGSTTCTPGEAANIYASISESFVVLAEKRAGRAVSTAATTYFDSLQCTSGGFTSGTTACGSGTADVDSTSYAIMALTALGSTQTAQLTAAENWLAGEQKSDGSWADNTDSTGLAAAALQGAGSSASAVSSARSWLLSQQQTRGRAAQGALRYDGTVTATLPKGDTSPSVLATAQGLTGLVDGGSLATVTAAKASSTVSYFAPVLHVGYAPVKPRQRVYVVANGFAAGETVRVALRGTSLGTATASPLGVVRLHVVVPSSARSGRTDVTAQGLSSGLTAQAPVTVS